MSTALKSKPRSRLKPCLDYDPDRLDYPTNLTDIVGLGVNEINFMKKKGCRFYGQKTSVTWIREYLRAVTAPAPVEVKPALGTDGHPSH